MKRKANIQIFLFFLTLMSAIYKEQISLERFNIMCNVILFFGFPLYPKSKSNEKFCGILVSMIRKFQKKVHLSFFFFI